MNKLRASKAVCGGAVIVAASVVMSGCSLINSANVIENIDAAAGVADGEVGEVTMPVGDIFDTQYQRVIFICSGATESDVDDASGGTWQGGSDEDDEWYPPSRGTVEIYRDTEGSGFSKYVTSFAPEDDLDVCRNMGGVVAVLPASEEVTFVRSEQDGPWVKQ
ncbi:hypothetical protein I6J72_03395 [Corynebacterium sp. FDAARGOS 1242]|uniref:hypothetical protein n=1 Tax=Corynebacterium sp. FDAARGOS 1242 TaxID=2778078 RepID=UPI00195228FA|nr:hypothetical protein [Corynebacterium sp. FDAARGOS 1242]QRP98605.1 hypothetical protein I6J72_03395 [Corynebacterium sp. FDAARGOS 1242]